MYPSIYFPSSRSVDLGLYHSQVGIRCYKKTCIWFQVLCNSSLILVQYFCTATIQSPDCCWQIDLISMKLNHKFLTIFWRVHNTAFQFLLEHTQSPGTFHPESTCSVLGSDCALCDMLQQNIPKFHHTKCQEFHWDKMLLTLFLHSDHTDPSLLSSTTSQLCAWFSCWVQCCWCTGR